MVINLVVLILFLTGVVGEQVPCSIGQAQCSSTNTASYIGNVLYCCPRDFGIQWKSGVQNGTPRTECVCDRQYYESDCYEGQAQCSGASSLSYDGNVVRCCRDGSAMSSSMTNVNGQTSGYCKCRRWVGNAPLINAEQLQYWNQWLSTFQNQLQYQLNAIQSILNPRLRINGFGQWVVPIFDGVRRGLNSVGGVNNNFGGNGNLQSPNSFSTNTQPSTQQMNRNQSQQHWNTRSFLDMLSPASWFNQSTNTTNGNQIPANDSVNSPSLLGPRTG